MIKQKGQLYWDDTVTTLTPSAFKEMLEEEKNGRRYYAAVAHFSALRTQIAPEDLKDFQWLKMEYTVPYFVDLCFRFRSRVFGIIFTTLHSDGVLEGQTGWEEKFRLCSENDIIPCFLPFNEKTDNVEKKVNGIFNLIDAVRYRTEGIIEEIDPLSYKDEEIRETSSWEKHNMAVMAIVENLHDKEEIDNILYQSYPGVQPAVCWLDKKNVFNWMVIDEVGERDLKPEMPHALLERIASNNGLGHYGLCEFSNPYAPNVFPRGQKFDLRFEITDL